ncbi:MAG: DUF4382 domain-containing protein [Chitinophagaceae bacterium]|nr:DUF4382 domain-containing protein [Chitinophagaceae bacterium]
MKTIKIFLGLATVVIVMALVFSACTKSGVNGNSSVAVFLTDGPGDFDAVNIDIQKVEVKVDKDEKHKRDDNRNGLDDDKDDHLKRKDDFGEWIDLNFTPKIIDVLSLRNGIETQLGTANIDAGTVRKIRITLGTQNSVVKGSVKYDLLMDSQTSNFLYIKLFDNHRERGNRNDVKVWVDFDIASSIVEANGKFYLKPVLRPFCNANFGEIEGKVLPLDAKAVVRVSNGNGFNAVALPSREGEFKVRGLTDGTYTVTIEGIAPYAKKIITNVVVKKGEDTKIGTITLVK